MSLAMHNRLALAVTLMACMLGCDGANAQTKVPPPDWVAETLALKDQCAFLNAIKAAPIVGSPPARITIIAFDSLEQAENWFNDPAAVVARTEAQKYATVRDYTVEGLGN